jgi:hypothetical protein
VRPVRFAGFAVSQGRQWLPAKNNERNETMSEESKNKKPVARVKVGKVQGAIFANSTENGVFYGTTFQNGYRVDGKWKNGHSFDLNGLLALQHAVGLAIDKVIALRDADTSDTAEEISEEEIAS